MDIHRYRSNSVDSNTRELVQELRQATDDRNLYYVVGYSEVNDWGLGVPIMSYRKMCMPLYESPWRTDLLQIPQTTFTIDNSQSLGQTIAISKLIHQYCLPEESAKDIFCEILEIVIETLYQESVAFQNKGHVAVADSCPFTDTWKYESDHHLFN